MRCQSRCGRDAVPDGLYCSECREEGSGSATPVEKSRDGKEGGLVARVLQRMGLRVDNSESGGAPRGTP